MRYADDNSVDEVLVWLKMQNCEIAPRNFHRFLVRVLRLMTLEQARDLGVDVDLLRAVRVRYKLPVDPKGARAVTGKPMPRHHARARRRRIKPRPKDVVRAGNVRTPRRSNVVPDMVQMPLIAELPPQPAPKLRGTLDDPQGRGDWKIINQMARKKVFAIDRSVVLNFQGIVTHTRTRHEYSLGELREGFGLTENEAESCFMTFTEASSFR